MSDGAGKTASSLAIAEKRPRRPGGCVGIFFQLFDWNRRLAKKKLFSKKLLPPARAKQASKKFGEDEKLPKFRLIADENCGGFPNVKKKGTSNVDSEQRHDMRTPGLVARLMGLESMPTVRRDKPKTASSAEIGCERSDTHVTTCHGVNKVDLQLKKKSASHEPRPQKLQKTGPFERRPVTRFGAETFQFKNVLSRSRKHHPKLLSPVKSPRSLSVRNTSRLIDAATKILEPGLQARNRAKCALSYLNTMHHASKDQTVLKGTTSLSPKICKSSNENVCATENLKGQSSCRNCGYILDVVESGPNIEEQLPVFASSVSDYAYFSYEGLERNKPGPSLTSAMGERERVINRSQEHSTSLAAEAVESIRPLISIRKPLHQEGQIHRHLATQLCKPQEDVPSSISSKQNIPRQIQVPHKQNTQRQSQVHLSRDGTSPSSKKSNLPGHRVSFAADAINETKDFIAMNRSSSGRTRLRMPTKMDNNKFDTERKFNDRSEDSLSPVRKRRPMNGSTQTESSGFVCSTSGKQRNISCGTMTGKEIRPNRHSMNRSCTESRLNFMGENNRTSGPGNKDNGVISFTFSSRVKHKTGIPAELEKRRNQNESSCNTPEKNSMLDDNDGKTSLQKPFLLRGDALGALLEQKLKELTNQEEEGMALGGNPPKKTTAMILRELIFALNTERPLHQDGAVVRSNQRNIVCCDGHTSDKNFTFQAKPKTSGTSLRCPQDSDHLSPGSVLEASFSNDSCFSSSLDDSSALKHHEDPTECSREELKPLEPDADLLDSATSLNKGKKDGRELVTDLLSQITGILCTVDLADASLNYSKLTHAKEVILNAELVCGNSVLHNFERTKHFSICSFLLDKLEILARIIWTNFGCFLGFDDTKGVNQLKGFVFDCIVEYLDTKCSHFSKFGTNLWTRQLFCMNSERLVYEVVKEVRRWMDLAGLIPDDLIDNEMSRSLGKWTDFEIEAFESGAAIGMDILQILVDEVVIDLLD